MTMVSEAPARRRIAGLLEGDKLAQFGPYLLLLVLCIVASLLSSAFLTSENITNILRQAAPLLIVAAGQTLVILVGGIDVSVGALVSMTTVIGGSVMQASNSRIPLTLALVVGVGLIVGLVHYCLIVRLNTDPFVTTLGSMLVLDGLNLVYTGGAPRSDVTPEFRGLAQDKILGIPIVVILVTLIVGALIATMRFTSWGRQVYATGGNSDAARLAGIRVERVKGTVYVLCSILAVLGGIFLLARIGTGDTNVGSDLALNSIAAVLIGGTAFGGGRGSVGGSVAGVLILTVLFNIFNLLGVTTYARPIVLGAVVILGIALYSRRKGA